MLLLTLAAADSSEKSSFSHGLTNRPTAKPYLRMPAEAEGELPRLLSETGAFKDTKSLRPSEALIPFDINVAFWSDGATKSRWIAVPNDASVANRKIQFRPSGEWTFPTGTVFVKHFELALDETRPDQRRRLETRLLVCNATGSVYGVTYKWRPDNSDAELLPTNLTENILIKTASGPRTQTWYYPSRADCRTCHTDLAGGVLGVKTRQMNRMFPFPSGVSDNQLRSWNHIGLFDPPCDEADLPHLSSLARSDDQTRSLEHRARSYLDASCGPGVLSPPLTLATIRRCASKVSSTRLCSSIKESIAPGRSLLTTFGVRLFSCASTPWMRSKCRRWRMKSSTIRPSTPCEHGLKACPALRFCRLQKFPRTAVILPNPSALR